MNEIERMKELINVLNEAGYHYYQLDKEIMPDIEYDRLYDELVSLEQKEGITLSESPTIKVGYEVLSGLKKVAHDSKILSLDKTKEVAKLESFLGDKSGVLSYKMDGLTIVLNYENGTLINAVTRGNGEVGEDVTHNAKAFIGVPLNVKEKRSFSIRGEGVISYSDFQAINSRLDDEEKYKNPRNLTSGSVRQLDAGICKGRRVRFMAFSFFSADFSFDTKVETLLYIKQCGFTLVPYHVVNSENVAQYVAEFSESGKTFDFATDGLVLCYDDLRYGQSLGQTSKFPRDSIAFKWKDELMETTLTDVIWNTSRTGLINPVAVFEPVDLEGTTVKQASLHNLSIIENLKIGIGDRITVYKANMIIPQIAENLTKKGGLNIPLKCPVCGGATEIRVIREGKALYCTNPICNAQLLRSLSHFTSRNAMNIEGLSEETLKKFLDAGIINAYPDIFNLKNHEATITTMAGMGIRSFTKLVANIEKARTCKLSAFINALGISQVGASNAKQLTAHFKNDLNAILSATAEEISAIEGFGYIIAESIVSYFQDETNLQLLESALSYLTFEEEREENVKTLYGLTFVITGDVTHFKNRKELQEVIEKMGGKATTSVSAKTSYLINNDLTSGSSKNKKAQELNVPIITEMEFVERFMEN